MTIDEIKAFAESTAPMLEWIKTKDIIQRDVVRAEVSKWIIDLEWFEETTHYPDGAICISAQEKSGGYSSAVGVDEAKERLLLTIGRIDKSLLEDVQTSLF